MFGQTVIFSAQPEISSELSRIPADHAERDARDAVLLAADKQVLFDELRHVGITHVLVSFDGAGDSGRIEACNRADQSVTLPVTEITFVGIDWYAKAPLDRRAGLERAVEQIVYGLLSGAHDGWKNEDGAHGEFSIDARAGSIHLELNERFTSSELFTHDF